MRQGAPQLEFVVTMPMAPSYLAAELPERPGRPGGYLPTGAALLRIAQSAQQRVVAMTPFIDSFTQRSFLAGERLAYVGSANFLGSGDGTSLEAGVLVDGRAAVQVARLIDGVLRVARRF